MTKATYLKTGGLIATAAFAITLAVLIGDRLSTEAMAVLAGAVCGVSAAIPTSLLIITVTQRHHAQTTPAPQQQFTRPVIFTVPPMPIQPPTPPPPATWENVPAQRHFTIVGDLSADQAEMGDQE